MTATDFLADLERRGIRVQADGDRLALDAPRGVLTPDVLAAIRECKATLVAALTARDGYCSIHGRFLVLRELEAGCCGWCEPDRFEWSPADRAAIDAMNAPREWPAFTTCTTCPAPLPPGNVYHCEPCIEVIRQGMRGNP